MNFFVSLMRTVVPYAVGLLLTVTGALGIDLDSDTATGVVFLAVGAVYYAAFRFVEQLAARLDWEPLRIVAGVLLGWARPPEYPGKDAALPPLTIKLDMTGFEEQVRNSLRMHGRRTDL